MNSASKFVFSALLSTGLLIAPATNSFAQTTIEEVIVSCTDAASCALAVQAFLATVPAEQLADVQGQLQASLTEAAANGDITQETFAGGFAEASTNVADGGDDLADNPLDTDVAASSN
ncbi:MAG: hypothetical protein K5905_30775 [Roseibium sp.]|uniref:hypothetical protein n=1 Tax=Roseibium sp. TaxID=1936156 RepID=UPI0026268CF7|nr:hypothetical protein [Roseibium sp.]MCV0429842.1 hypothetical protein [Roseibium sp.]